MEERRLLLALALSVLVITAWRYFVLPPEPAEPSPSPQSLQATAPEKAPSGLAELSSVWTAPIPDYAPPWMQSEAFGYIMSALTGAGLIILVFFLISWIARAVRRAPDVPTPRAGPGTI